MSVLGVSCLEFTSKIPIHESRVFNIFYINYRRVIQCRNNSNANTRPDRDTKSG